VEDEQICRAVNSVVERYLLPPSYTTTFFAITPQHARSTRALMTGIVSIQTFGSALCLPTIYAARPPFLPTDCQHSIFYKLAVFPSNAAGGRFHCMKGLPATEAHDAAEG